MDDLISRFDLFCKEVCEVNRYFYSDDTNQFLDDLYKYITGSSKGITKLLPCGTSFYRARAHDFINTDNAYSSTPFEPEDMKPIPNIRANGRLNAYNVNALYLSYNKSTAISEARANAEAPVSVAEFKSNKDLTVIRFDYSSNVSCWSTYFDRDITFTLAHRFSQPLDNPQHQSREYIPTQIISEFLKSKGIDGIEYPSQFISLHEADIKDEAIAELLKTKNRFNLCLFDMSSADCDPASIEVLKLIKRVNIISTYKKNT